MAKTYPRSAYTNPFPAGVSRNNAKERGWGNGWPYCQSGKMKTVSGGGIRVTVREEVAEMVMHLLSATDKQYNLIAGETGAYNCRPIAGTRTPSNHSWGLAVDINWNHNPYSYTFRSEIPPSVVKMWNDAGWYWGGFYANRKDTMHFEYIGRPSDVAAHTARAKRANGVVAPSTPKPPATSPNTDNWTKYFQWERGDDLRTIKQWDRGDDVKMVQRYLGVKDDGFYGPNTVKRVKEYQMSQDLQADGVIGPRTWRKITRFLDVT
jgi:hypothetical protein